MDMKSLFRDLNPRPVTNLKACTSINYGSRVVLTSKVLIFTTLEM